MTSVIGRERHFWFIIYLLSFLLLASFLILPVYADDATPSATATSTPTFTPTVTPTATFTPTPTTDPSATATPTSTPTYTPTPTPTPSPTLTPTSTPTSTPTFTPTPTLTVTPTPTKTPTLTVSPTLAASPSATATQGAVLGQQISTPSAQPIQPLGHKNTSQFNFMSLLANPLVMFLETLVVIAIFILAFKFSGKSISFSLFLEKIRNFWTKLFSRKT